MKRSWQIESSSGKGLLLAVGSLLVGILFVWLTSRIAVQDSNTTAAMWLGVLLAGVGLAGLIFDERIVTTVDPASVGYVIAAALGAVVLYAAWFRFSVGPWCPAMWFGNAPPVFILAGFALLLGLLRRFS
jgi:hypothetical protein